MCTYIVLCCSACAPSNVSRTVCRYYGCGLVFPEAVEGCRVLDLGSGSGRDCFVLSKLVGPEGFVTGVDMTQEQVSMCVCACVCACVCVCMLACFCVCFLSLCLRVSLCVSVSKPMYCY